MTGYRGPIMHFLDVAELFPELVTFEYKSLVIQ